MTTSALAPALRAGSFAVTVAGLAFLVACQNEAARPATTQASAADSAEQVMYGINTILTENGMRQAMLEADTGYFYDENTRIELRRLKLTFFSRTGEKASTLTSLEGTYNTRTELAEARKNVVVVGEDGRRLSTSHLRFDQNRNEVSSDSAFVFTQPGRQRVSGVGFTADPDMKNVRAKVGSGNFTLPGQ